MKPLNLMIHCDLEAMPMRQMPTAWHEPAVDGIEAVAGRPVEIIYQSPPCFSYSRPPLRTTAAEGAK